ncbi:hypothetical protein GN956_G3430 [Arapaima gigas]
MRCQGPRFFGRISGVDHTFWEMLEVEVLFASLLMPGGVKVPRRATAGHIMAQTLKANIPGRETHPNSLLEASLHLVPSISRSSFTIQILVPLMTARPSPLALQFGDTPPPAGSIDHSHDESALPHFTV